MGGLTAAGLLAKAGHGVTLYERAPVCGGKAGVWSEDGLTLDTGPTLLTLPGFVREVFDALGALDLLPRLVELPLQCEYHDADGRSFQSWRSLEASIASAERVESGEGLRLRAFYSEAAAIYRAAGEAYLEAPYQGLPQFVRRVLRRGVGAAVRGLAFRSLSALGRRHFQSPLLRKFVGRYATYMGASPHEASAAFALVAHLEHAEGVHHVQGGMGALARTLERAVAREGVEIRLGQPAVWERDRSGFWAGPRGEGQHFDALVVNADPLEALGQARPPLSLSGYVLLIGVEGRADLPHHSVLFARDYDGEFADLFQGKVSAEPTLYVCHPSATEPALASSSRDGLYVMVNAPTLAPGCRFEAGPFLRRLCYARLEAQWPALRGRLSVLAERTPEDFRRLGAPGGSLYGFLPHGKLGPFRRPRIRGPVPGLFFAGGGTHPGGGVPLAMRSGRFAAELATDYLQRLGRRAA
jgi:phytoene desaturase